MGAYRGNQTKIRVFLVDDHPIVREGVRSYLVSHDIAVVGEASDADEALRKVKVSTPDVIVLDINLPAVDGGELARRLRRILPKTQLIAFSIHSSEEYVMRMARCGVHGYVTKGQPVGDLLEAIKHVFAGNMSFPPGMGDAFADTPMIKTDNSGLTQREVEVLKLLTDGLSNKAVAAKLGISVRTAETHREHLVSKLKIHTLAGLTKYAITHGLTAV